MVQTNQQAAQTIEQLADREAVAMANGNMDVYQLLLHQDAIFLPPNTLPKHGSDLRNWMGEFIHNYQIEWDEFVHEETVVFGEYGYHRYTYSWRITPKSGGKEIVAQGKGLHIMRLMPDAGWKIFREIWNSNPSL